MPEGYGPIFDLILSGKLNVEQLISHRLPLAQVEHGLHLMDTKAEQVRVEIGDSAGELVAVRGELAAGDRVAIRGAENLSEGADVRILVSETASASGAADTARNSSG